MTTHAIKLITLGLYGRKSATPHSGSVAKGRTEVLRNLGGSRMRCTSGALWVTLEGDTRDYVLTQNQSLPIPNLGKVLVSGSGTYQI